MKKILFVNNFFSPFGGAEKIMYQESLALKDKGFQVEYFATDKKPYFDNGYKNSDFFTPFHGHQKNLSTVARVIHNSKAQSDFKEALHQLKPDIVHIHNIHYHLTSAVLEVLKQENIPTVMTLHDPRIFCPGGKLIKGEKGICDNPNCYKGDISDCVKNKCKDNSLLKSVLAALEAYNSCKNKRYETISRFICPSLAMMNLALNQGIEKSKLELLYNFIDIKKHQLQKVRQGSYFLYVGRLSAEKGIDVLIDTFSKIPHINCHIVGDGPDRDVLENKVKDLNLPNIIFKGYQEGQKLCNEYESCIATILPSNWFENNPISVLESFLYSKPCIAADIGGLSEIVKDGLNGYTFKAGDSLDLLEAVTKTQKNLQNAFDMGIYGKEFLVDNFNIDIHIDSLISIYNSVLNEGFIYENIINK